MVMAFVARCDREVKTAPASVSGHLQGAPGNRLGVRENVTSRIGFEAFSSASAPHHVAQSRNNGYRVFVRGGNASSGRSHRRADDRVNPRASAMDYSIRRHL